MLLAALFLVTMGCVDALATTYKLRKVTSVSAGNYYVFEQDGYVMKNTISSNSLTCTSSYNTQGLTGEETYVWQLIAQKGGFNMKNRSLNASQYLNSSTKGSTNLSLGSYSTIWTFDFQEDGSALIQASNNDNRFLGYTDASSHKYKAYADTQANLSYYPHAINVYQLIEEKEKPTIAVSDWTIAYGDTYTLDISGFVSGNVTLTSSNTAVATVDGLTLTSVAAGSTTIMVSTEETENYEAGEEAFTLVITGPDGNTTNAGALSTTTSVTTAGGFATYCYMYPLNLNGVEGAKAYKVSSVDLVNDRIFLTQLTGTIQGGVPFILKADGEDDTFEIPLAESSTNVPEDNALLGTLVPTFVPQTSGNITNFAYSKTKECFVKIGSAGNTVPLNRAYLPVNIGSEVKSFSFVFTDTDGISALRVKNEVVENEVFIFNLAGQRMSKLLKGVNIVNGKKRFVK